MPPKLHLDEHLSPRLALQLRMHGFDVTCTHEQAMLADDDDDDDDEQLAFAALNERALVTFNHKDFATRHAQYLANGQAHWGIILSTEEAPSAIRHRLLRLLNSLSAEELINQLRWLNEFK